MISAVPSTQRVYLQDSSLSQLSAKVVDLGKDEEGQFVVFDKTLFHPQGGGQPDDQGYFEVEGTRFVVKKLSAPSNPQAIPFIIRHYYDISEAEKTKLKVDQVVLQKIDLEIRRLHARYHSAGHLLSNAVNRLCPSLDGCGGHHFPKQASVSFEGIPTPEILQELKQKVPELVNKFVQDKLPCKNMHQNTPRLIQFGELPPYQCGGTHVLNSEEIGRITIRNFKKDKTRLKIGYDIE